MNIDFDDLVMWVVIEKPSIPDIEVRLKNLRSLYQSRVEQNWATILSVFKIAMLGSKHK